MFAYTVYPHDLDLLYLIEFCSNTYMIVTCSTYVLITNFSHPIVSNTIRP